MANITKLHPVSIVVLFVTATIVTAGIFDLRNVDINDKDPACHMPIFSVCNASAFHFWGYERIAWFFNPLKNSCQELYSPDGLEICSENNDLPLTQDDCKKLCVLSCQEPEEPCRPYSIKCCPRHYKPEPKKEKPEPKKEKPKPKKEKPIPKKKHVVPFGFDFLNLTL